MLEEDTASLNKQIQSILARSTPEEERANLEHILSNVMLFINQARGEKQAGYEDIYPSIPLFAHYLLLREASDAAEAFQRRLDIIDRYKIADAQRIINIIVSARLAPTKEKITLRRIQLLLELHRNPHLHQYQLAESVSASQRIVSKELNILRRDFAFRILNHIDPHRFKLAQQMVVFRTKSLEASEQLEQYYQRNRPTFLHTWSFDQDYRHGYLTYYVPDQPRGHRVFEERIRQIGDNFFEEYYLLRLTGIQVNISFDGYDPKANTWKLNINSVSEDILHFIQKQCECKPQQVRGMYANPIHFDQVDYLLGQTSFAATGTRSYEFKRGVLRQFGFELSNKAIWKREKRLQKVGVFLPAVYFEIPEFEELVMLVIECSTKAREVVKQIISVLPYSFTYPIDMGLVVFFQRPSFCSAITGQLVSTINTQPEISNVDVLRLEATIGSSMVLNAADRWDASRQRWILQEGDI